MKDFNINKDLVGAIENDNLIIFVGAGFSKKYGFPSWKDLVFGILNDLSLDDTKYEGLKKVLEDNLFTEIEILDKILVMDPNNRGKVYEILEACINREMTGFDLSIPKKMGDLSSKIITTNYDLVLEKALPSFKKIVHDDDFHIAKLPEIKEFIFKLHGSIEKPQDCVLFRENYENLYSNETAAVERLKSFVADKTILFVGFSFNDEYVKETFKYISQVYKTYNKTHYLLTTNEVDFADYGLKPVCLKSWDELPEFLDYLITKKNNLTLPINSIQLVEKDDVKLVSKKESVFKIAIMYSNPIDTEIFYNLDNILKYLLKFNIEIDCYHLTEEHLNELEGYNYVFIFTKEAQKKIIIEDEYFRKKIISVKRLEDELSILKPEGIFIFLDKVTDLVEGENLKYPIAIFKYEENLNNLFFKLLKKANLDNLNYTHIYNSSRFLLSYVEKGKGFENKNTGGLLSTNIERKNLINFVGRKIDITDIIRKILDGQDRIITIKGSGGIGKTAIVKKIALEFHERGLFKDGIDFIDCEFVKDYKTFERNIARTFNLENSINFVEHMGSTGYKADSLMILDNFEPLLYLDDVEKMKDLITFISDYKTVIVTSREWIGFEFEEKHELRSFTSEEAVALFERLYVSNISVSDRKILKEDILEKLLNNNPLAIKIVTQNIPKSLSMEALKDELKDDFFRATNTGYIDIYDNEVDGNIERSVSLFQSIYYSYIRLSPREQLVFEILSLFPNGIPMEAFKNFFNTNEFKTDIYRITNKELRSLENKSIIEINGGFISLQSIIGRFAEFHLNKRTEEEKYKYYKRAFAFNSYLLALIEEINDDDKVESLRIFDKNEDNFIKSLEYINQLNLNNIQFIEYINILVRYFQGIGQLKKFRKQLIKCDKIFSDILNGTLLKDMIIAYLKYYEGDFEAAFDFLVCEMTFERLENLEPDTERYIKRSITSYALNLYSLEGYEYQVLQFCLKNNIYHLNHLDSNLFKLGAYKLLEEIKKQDGFFHFEIQLNTGVINIDNLETYIDSGIYNKQYIELMQTNYIKTKMGIYNAELIEKLVVTNPYTMGIKDLMLALIEKSETNKIKLFEQAIDKLSHIKYYYLEAIYFYCEFLKSKNQEEFIFWSKLGKELSEKYHYYFQLHRFNVLINGKDSLTYDEEYYIAPIKDELSKFENNRNNKLLAT